MFSARYGMNPYITQIRIIFKGLRIAPHVIMNGNISTKFYISLGISFIACILDRLESDASFSLWSQYVLSLGLSSGCDEHIQRKGEGIRSQLFSAYIII